MTVNESDSQNLRNQDNLAGLCQGKYTHNNSVSLKVANIDSSKNALPFN